METGQTDTEGAPVTVVATQADGTEIEVEMALGIISDEAQRVVGAVAALRPGGTRRPLESYAPTPAAS